MKDGTEGIKRFKAYDRRTGGDRRQREKALKTIDQQTAAERRATVDRRSLLYGLIHTTASATSRLEEWMGQNCDGAWNLEVVGTEPASNERVLRVMFEVESDKAKFSAWKKRS